MTALEDHARQPIGFVIVLREVSESTHATDAPQISLPMKFDRRKR
jgi:hypothetical protein